MDKETSTQPIPGAAARHGLLARLKKKTTLHTGGGRPLPARHTETQLLELGLQAVQDKVVYAETLKAA